MKHKPHIERDHIKGALRISKAGNFASLILTQGYNSPYLRILPGTNFYQFLK